MKQTYHVPELKKIDFNYKDQIVAQSYDPDNMTKIACKQPGSPTPDAMLCISG